MLRSDDRAKKEEAVYQEISKLQNQLEDVKAEKLALERENVRVLARLRQLETQLSQITQERDRLIEISSDLKVQVAQSEKRSLLQSNCSQAPNT